MVSDPALQAEVVKLREQARSLRAEFKRHSLAPEWSLVKGTLYEPLVEQLSLTGLLEPDGLVVLEHFHKRLLPETMGGLRRTREVRVGDHRLSFYRTARGAQA